MKSLNEKHNYNKILQLFYFWMTAFRTISYITFEKDFIAKVG